jgi:WD40 repeat protein
LLETLLISRKFNHTNKLAIVTSEQNIVVVNYEMTANGLEFVVDYTLPGYNDEVIDAKFVKKNDEQNYVIYATNSSQIRALFLETGDTKFLWGHSDIVLSVDTFGNYIASSSKDNMIKVWEFVDNNFVMLATLKGHTKSVGTINFGPMHGKTLISGSADQTVKLWSLQDLKNYAGEPLEITSAKCTTMPH